MRAALNPFASTIGYLLPFVVSGSIIVSVVLSLPTVGPLLLRSLVSQDMLLASSIILLLGVLTVVGTLLGGTLVKAFGYKIVPLVAHARHAGAEMLIGGRRQEAADKREAPSPRP